MIPDKYTATWVSHSSIRDFLNCPRLYFLRNVYKDPNTNHKATIMNPPLATGQAVHEVIESLSVIPAKKRFATSLIKLLDVSWEKVTGEKGGFENEAVEHAYRTRAEDMLRRVMKNPGPLENLALKIHMDLPHYYLSEEDGIILCGKIDWLEYLPDTDSVHIIDFKTGKGEEDADSLQLPIYTLIVTNTQNRPLTKASYWYIDRDNEPTNVEFPDVDEAKETVLKIAKDVALARKLNRFKCPQGNGCRHCRPYEMVIEGKAKLVGINDFGQDIYVVDSQLQSNEDRSSIL